MHNYHATQKGFDSDREEQLAILRSIKKNTLNHKIMNKRAAGDSGNFKEGVVLSKKSLSTINPPEYTLSNGYTNGILPNLKLTNNHQASQDEETTKSNSPGELHTYGRAFYSRREESRQKDSSN